MIWPRCAGSKSSKTVATLGLTSQSDLECRAVRNRCLHCITDSYVPLRSVARQLEACLVNTRSDPRFQSRQQNSDKSTLADLNLRDRMNERKCVSV